MAKKGENIYKRKDGRWEGRCISGRKPDGSVKYASVYGKSYREVKALLEKHKGQRIKPIPPCNLTVKLLMETWLSLRVTVVKESTYQRYEALINCHILPYLGGVRVNNLTAQMISDYIQKLQKEGRIDGRGGLSEKTVCDVLCVFRSAIKFAAKNNDINANDLFDIATPTIKQKRVDTLGDAEYETMIRSIYAEPDLNGAAYLLALNLGLRLGEVCGLKWSDINFAERLLYINRTVIRLKSGNHTKLMVQTPKTESAVRILPVPAEILVFLIKLKNTRAPDAYVFTGSRTIPQEPRTLEARFKRFLSDHGLRSIHFHTLRHTFATRCVEHGIDAKTISEILGHANVKTTLQLYVHPSMSYKREAVESVTVLPAVI